MNKCIPKHIDPRESVERTDLEEIRDLSKMMHQSGDTPYRYVRRAFHELCHGNYMQAMHWLNYAGSFKGVFYAEDSEDNEYFKVSIGMLRYEMLFLYEQFKGLRPEKEE